MQNLGIGGMRNRTPEQLVTAYHEAGHAVMYIHLGLPVRRATILPDEEAETDGHVEGAKPPQWILTIAETGDVWEHPKACSYVIRQICVFKAGHIAQQRFSGCADHDGASGDYRGTLMWLTMLAPEDAEQELSALDGWLEARTVRLLDVLWESIERVAQALCEHKSLSGHKIRRIMREATPGAIPDGRPTAEAQRRSRAAIACWLTSESTEWIKNQLQTLPPGERQLWQRVERDMKAGRMAVIKTADGGMTVTETRVGKDTKRGVISVNPRPGETL